MTILLALQIKQLLSYEAELVQQPNAGDEKKTSPQIIPTTQHILGNYEILTILEKNQLWKLVLKKATVYRSQDDELSMQSHADHVAYAIDMFTKRNLALENEIKQLRESEEDLLKQKSEEKQKEAAHTQIIPTAQHILEIYSILSLEEKNRLWKLVLKKITIYRSPDDDITIRIHPNLPK